MQHRNNSMRLGTALTIVEMVVSLAIMAIIFATILPLFSNLQKNWRSKQTTSEILQNGRIFIDHISRNLVKAVTITAVSGPSVTQGYIQFEDNDGNSLGYGIGAGYVEFGPVGTAARLAGPVSELRFTCYDANNFVVPCSEPNAVRFVQATAVLADPYEIIQDKTFTTSVYLRSNANKFEEGITPKTALEFDGVAAITPVLAEIDDTHYLCAYTAWDSSGRVVVLTVNTDDWTISKGLTYSFDTDRGYTPGLAQIDEYNYLCAYEGTGSDGWAVILTVTPGTWSVAKGTAFRYDASTGKTPALSQIDDTHFLCAYTGGFDDGWCTVLTVDTGTKTITAAEPREFDSQQGVTPALSKIDSQHHLCAYRGQNSDGYGVVLTVDTGTWSVTKETAFEFDKQNCEQPALSKIDDAHYLCAYEGKNNDGWATVLIVEQAGWTITQGAAFEYNTQRGITPALSQIEPERYICAYQSSAGDGWAVVLVVNLIAWTISKQTPAEFDIIYAMSPDLAKIDERHYLCAYRGSGYDGWAVVLEEGMKIRP